MSSGSGEEHAQSALEGADCEHCKVLPLRTLRSHLAFFHKENAQARVPWGSGPTAAEAQRRLQSWGSQMSAGLEMDTALSIPSPDRSSASYQGWEARAAVSSTPIEAQTLQPSDSEDLDVVRTRETEDSAGSGNGTRSESSVRERGDRMCASLQQGNRVLQPVFHSSKEGWGVVSHFRSSRSERLRQAAQVQD